MTVGNWKTHLIVNCTHCQKPMGFHTNENPICNGCKNGAELMTTTTVYCARWRSHQSPEYAESVVSWAALETIVFGQAYAPNRADVSFTSYQRRQDVS